jgi:hypothetical protein
MADATVWQMQMGSRSAGANIAVFDPGYITRPDGSKQEPGPIAPLLANADFCTPPLYMWKEREPETWSDDDEFEKKDANSYYEKRQMKGVRSRSRRVQWHLQDSDEPDLGGMHMEGEKVEQQSSYVLLEVQHTEDGQDVIKVASDS